MPESLFLRYEAGSNRKARRLKRVRVQVDLTGIRCSLQ